MSKGVCSPTLSVSLSLSEGTSIYTCVGINIKRRSVKGKETPNSITTQDVKGQTHIKAPQRAKALLRGSGKKANLV